MQKALIVAKNENIASTLLEHIKWENVDIEEVKVTKDEKEAVILAKEEFYDVVIINAEDFSWKKLYIQIKTILRRVDVILIYEKEDFAFLKTALEEGVMGVVSCSELKGKTLMKLLEKNRSRRRSANIVGTFISGEDFLNQIQFQLNGNNSAYFENLFDEISSLDEDKEIIQAICVKLLKIIYDYLERQGFKNVEFQRVGAVKKLKEIEHIADSIGFVRERYKNIFQFEIEKNQNYYYALAESIKEYIINNYAKEAIGVPKIAERFHFSSNYVNGIFKSQTGETIPSFITNLRLSKAQKLLTETKIPISDIAIEVGYSRLTYFSRIFKRKYNISPLEYRNKFLKAE